MLSREDVLEYGLTFSNVYVDTPFHDPNWVLLRYEKNKRAFAWTYEREGHIWVNVKVDPEWRDFWRNTYLSELQLYHDKKMLTPTDLGLNTGIWKTIANNSYKTGNTIHLNMEIYTTSIIVANNVYNNAFTIPSQYRPLIDTAVNVTASDGAYKNPVACTSLAKSNGNLFFCIPKATNNYLFIDAEWEIK